AAEPAAARSPRCPCSRHSARRPARPGSPGRATAIVRRRAPRRQAQPPRRGRCASWPGRRGRECLRVLLDHLLHVGGEPNHDLLADIDVEVHVDRLVRRFHRDAAVQRHGKRGPGRELGAPCPLSGHFFPPGGGDCFAGCDCGAGAVVCSSCLLVLSTSTLSAGESIGKGITGAMTCVGSLNPFAIWISARNGPLMLTFSRSGICANTLCTSPATKPWVGPSDGPSIVRLVANSPARSPFRRTIIDLYLISVKRSNAIPAASPPGLVPV